jgi:hypothetical protein
MTPNFHGIRSVFLLLSIGLVAATLFPEIALLPIQELVLHMRAPETAPLIARWIFGAGAVLFGVILVTWDRACTAALRVIAFVIELPARSFWMLVFACAIVPRLFVALVISYEPTADARWLHEAAASLARGEGFAVDGKLTAYRPPGYPFLLSLTYRLSGPISTSHGSGALLPRCHRADDQFHCRRLYGRPWQDWPPSSRQRIPRSS